MYENKQFVGENKLMETTAYIERANNWFKQAKTVLVKLKKKIKFNLNWVSAEVRRYILSLKYSYSDEPSKSIVSFYLEINRVLIFKD